MYALIAILVVLWLVGLIGNIGGGLINLLLVGAIIMFIVNMFSSRRGTL